MSNQLVGPTVLILSDGEMYDEYRPHARGERVPDELFEGVTMIGHAFNSIGWSIQVHFEHPDQARKCASQTGWPQSRELPTVLHMDTIVVRCGEHQVRVPAIRHSDRSWLIFRAWRQAYPTVINRHLPF